MATISAVSPLPSRVSTMRRMVAEQFDRLVAVALLDGRDEILRSSTAVALQRAPRPAISATAAKCDLQRLMDLSPDIPA